MARKAKRYNAMANVVCVLRGGSRASGASRSRTSIGLSTVYDIKATTKLGAERAARRTWRSRGELPVPGMKRKAACKLHASVEEAS
jgi:hypothetical protein